MPSLRPPSLCVSTCLLFLFSTGHFRSLTRPSRGFAGFPTRSLLSYTCYSCPHLRASRCQPTWAAVPQRLPKPASSPGRLLGRDRAVMSAVRQPLPGPVHSNASEVGLPSGSTPGKWVLIVCLGGGW